MELQGKVRPSRTPGWRGGPNREMPWGRALGM
nr:MAG TPA: hypothetical protein [Caudoviricetes sp.]